MSESNGKPVNKQLYENSGLKELFEQQEGGSVDKNDPLGLFFNQKTPNLAILHEKPEHRLLLYLKAQGLSNREIAEQSGYTDAWLSQLFRQPWAQLRLLEIMNGAGKDRVQTLLEGAAEDSVITLINLRDDTNVSDGVRRQAADSLLDRFLGKPKQQLDVVQKKGGESVEDLDREIELLKSKAASLTGRN